MCTCAIKTVRVNDHGVGSFDTAVLRRILFAVVYLPRDCPSYWEVVTKIQHGTGWDVPYSPMCLMVQWDGMDTRDWGYSVGLGGMSHTVLALSNVVGLPKSH